MINVEYLRSSPVFYIILDFNQCFLLVEGTQVDYRKLRRYSQRRTISHHSTVSMMMFYFGVIFDVQKSREDDRARLASCGEFLAPTRPHWSRPVSSAFAQWLVPKGHSGACKHLSLVIYLWLIVFASAGPAPEHAWGSGPRRFPPLPAAGREPLHRKPGGSLPCRSSRALSGRGLPAAPGPRPPPPCPPCPSLLSRWGWAPGPVVTQGSVSAAFSPDPRAALRRRVRGPLAHGSHPPSLVAAALWVPRGHGLGARAGGESCSAALSTGPVRACFPSQPPSFSSGAG